jgi:prepilin-type N-terminal cleavage/methylation domain-containing protein
MRTHQRPRNAFTLVELLVACLVLAIGVLGLASTSVAVARLTGDAARAGAAVERGHARMESLRASYCAPAAGTLLTGGISEWWSAAPAPGGASLQDSVRYTEGVHHDLHTESLASEAWCP